MTDRYPRRIVRLIEETCERLYLLGEQAGKVPPWHSAWGGPPTGDALRERRPRRELPGRQRRFSG